MNAFHRIISIVEGHGEVEALPLLIRLIFEQNPSFGSVDVLKPIRHRRDQLIKDNSAQLIKATQLSILKLQQASPTSDFNWILVLIDAEDDCVAKVSRTLRQTIADHPAIAAQTKVVIAERCFESWFAASATSMLSVIGLSEEAAKAVQSDSKIHGKGWLKKYVTHYRETVDQPRLTASMDTTIARKHNASLNRLVEIFDSESFIANEVD